ncbi:MAG: TlpA family protein disulfide reductase [Acidobacteria bacterium]|nr:TlpA family protein disulfide reductase [Acidobacteriota bacterium]
MKIHWASRLRSIVFTLIITFLLTITYYPQQQSPNPSLADLRARNFKINTLQGKSIELNSLLGQGKPVILDIWASSCGPCRQEIPHLIQFAKTHSKEGLIVIGLTIEDPKEDLKAVKSFVKEFSMNYEVAFAPLELLLFFNGSRSGLIPQTMVFHSNGKMVRHLIGYNEKTGKRILDQAVALALQPVN